MNQKPLKIMYFSPVAGDELHDKVFAEMARDNKLPGTEVHVTSCLPARVALPISSSVPMRRW